MENSWRILNHLTGVSGGDGTGLRQTGRLMC